MKKILCVANSFGEDVTYYLHDLAKFYQEDVKVVNLFVGGCSFQQHWEFLQQPQKNYRYELDGEFSGRYVDLDEALSEEKWDHIISQQVSGLSGVLASYEPEATYLYDYIQKKVPQAKLWLQETWAYEINSPHPQFSHYHYQQQEMAQKIFDTTQIMAKRLNLSLIPTGEVIKTLRQTPTFNVLQKGPSLCRDGFHLDYVYGRYAGAACLGKKILQLPLDSKTYLPKTPLAPERIADKKVITLINRTVQNVVENLDNLKGNK